MNTVTIGKKIFRIPENWDELTPRQFVFVVSVLSAGDLEGEAAIKGRLAILRVLMGMSWALFRFFPTELLFRLWGLVAWVTEEISITRQLLPYFKVGFRKYYGPSADFENLRTAEFCLADMFFLRWKDSGDHTDLLRFVSVLYRPRRYLYNARRNKEGDVRRPLNENEVEFYAHRLRQLDLSIANAVVVLYESYRKQLELDHPRIFNGANTSRAVIKGWFPVFRGIAATGTYGPLKYVEEMHMGTMLVELETMKDEEMELRRKHPELFKK